MTRPISNSEVSNFQQCQYKHFFGHRLGLQAIRRPGAMARGIVGHEALSLYYTALKAGVSWEDARVEALGLLTSRMVELCALGDEDPYRSDDVTMLSELTTVLTKYMNHYQGERWNILHVEEKFTTDITETQSFAMRLDLLVELTEGKYAGYVAIVDHKFVYDFWSPADMMLNAQIPKYMHAVAKHYRIPVKVGIINQIRHRVLVREMFPSEMFQREFMFPQQREIDTIVEEHAVIGERIQELDKLSVKEHRKKIVRNISKLHCPNCEFAAPCKTMLLGEDPTLMLNTRYRGSDYGYE